MVGVGLVSSLSGCTAVGTVEVDVIIENTGPREERTEVDIDREETSIETQTIELDAGDERTVSVGIERGDVIVVSKGGLAYEFTLDDYLCQNPTIQVDTGHGALGVSGDCFDFERK